MHLAALELSGESSSGYAVGWLTLALVNSGLAQGKRLSGIIWFLISLLIGPLATLLIVVMPSGGDTRR
jgi:biotin transporter BioY